MFRKFILLLFSSLLLISSISYRALCATNDDIDITADSALLMDANTGQYLYSKNMNTPYAPASTTKAMTALLAMENCSMDDIATIGKNPPRIEGSRAGIAEGENIKIKDLLYGLFLVSGNDCAVALAEHISGSQEKFVELMNKRAKEIGCKNANFVNCSGLYNDNHKLSAEDLALIMCELSKHSEFKEICTSQTYKIIPLNKPDAAPHVVSNENKLVQKGSIYYYPGCEGGKTGYTIQSLFSYTAVASRNGKRLIVTLVHSNSKNYFSEARKLLDYGFNNFQLTKIYSKGEKLQSYPIDDDKKIDLICSEDFYWDMKNGDINKPSISLINEDLSKKSFKAGDIVLKSNLTLNDEIVGKMDLISNDDHIIKSIFSSPINEDNNILPVYIAIGAGTIGLLFLAFIIKKRLKKTLKE